MTLSVDVVSDLEALYAAIMARATGRQIASAGHKDKQSAFTSATLEEMIKIYRQLWTPACGLPELNELGRPTTKRGRPARVFFDLR